MIRSLINPKEKLKLLVVAVLLVQLASMVIVSRVSAAALTNTSVRLSRMSAGQAATVRIAFTVPAGNSATEEKLRITFADNFTIATSGISASSTDCSAEGVGNTLPGTYTYTSSNAASSKHITISGLTNLGASTNYCVDITGGVTNTGAAGLYTSAVETQLSNSSVVDSTSVPLRIVSSGADQVTVNATVPPSFTFAISSPTTTFDGPLSSSTRRVTSGSTVSVSTNASLGWIVWIRDANSGLYSASAGKTIASPAPSAFIQNLVDGTEGYGVSAQIATNGAGGGTPAIDPAFDAASTTDEIQGVNTTFQKVAESSGTANNDQITVFGKATIAADTPAATDYTDVWTIVGAGNF